MKNIHRSFLLLALLGLASTATFAAEKDPSPPPAKDSPPKDGHRTQIAILLDTSNSMDGLIEQVKTQLWSVVNTFVAAKCKGETPYVEVALYEYGNNGLRAESNWIRLVRPFTRDLDQVSADLFKLTTNGGEEYCGAVIERAIADLDWDKSKDVYKAIFIAGNEPFTQGPIDPNNACRAAAALGVIVNTVHCGPAQEGINGGWRLGSALGGGRYLVINQDKLVRAVHTPQDDEILRLNGELNRTYVGYGALAPAAAGNQAAQDDNAKKKAYSDAAVQRAVTKASPSYCNRQWDLVDACKQKDFDVTKVEESSLPAELRDRKAEEKRAWIAGKEAERTALQKRILELNAERSSFLAKAAKDKAKDTLDQVVTDAVKEEAAKKGYVFEK